MSSEELSLPVNIGLRSTLGIMDVWLVRAKTEIRRDVHAPEGAVTDGALSIGPDVQLEMTISASDLLRTDSPKVVRTVFSLKDCSFTRMTPTVDADTKRMLDEDFARRIGAQLRLHLAGAAAVLNGPCTQIDVSTL